MTLPSKTLFYKGEGSDKEYSACIETHAGRGEGFHVMTSYGRRGGPYTSGRKTTIPVNIDEATKIFDKLIREKMSKGYIEGEGDTKFVGTDKEARVSGELPQLLNAVDDLTLEALIADDDFIMQEKKDGRRTMIKYAQNHEPVGINRKGLTIPLPVNVAGKISTLKGSFTLDGEMVGTTFFAFDILDCDGFNIRKKPYMQRWQTLLGVLRPLLNPAGNNDIGIVDCHTGAGCKREMVLTLKKEQAEGVVFKRVDSPYEVGRPSSGGPQLKYKFTATASVIAGATKSGKRSVQMWVTDADGDDIDVGYVTIPPNFLVPKEGTICEIKYLYSYPLPGGCLFQPVFQGERDDVGREAATTSQLKFKQGEEEES